MYFMYVDESGDSGVAPGATRYFCLSGMVVHEVYWRDVLDKIKDFRVTMRDVYGLKIRQEIHAAAFIGRVKEEINIPRHKRLSILRNFADELANIPPISFTNIVLDKEHKDNDLDVFSYAWRVLFQRFENTMRYRNFANPGNKVDYGIVFCDDTEGKKLNKIMRRMNVYNPVPNQIQYGQGYRDMPIKYIIEDPILRNSEHSYFIQAADLCAYLLYQKYHPNAYFKKKGATNYFNRLAPVLNVRASSKNPLGIVEI